MCQRQPEAAAGDLFTRLGESEEFAATQPSRTKYLLLVFGYLRRLLELPSTSSTNSNAS